MSWDWEGLDSYLISRAGSETLMLCLSTELFVRAILFFVIENPSHANLTTQLQLASFLISAVKIRMLIS